MSLCLANQVMRYSARKYKGLEVYKKAAIDAALLYWNAKVLADRAHKDIPTSWSIDEEFDYVNHALAEVESEVGVELPRQ